MISPPMKAQMLNYTQVNQSFWLQELSAEFGHWVDVIQFPESATAPSALKQVQEKQQAEPWTKYRLVCRTDTTVEE